MGRTLRPPLDTVYYVECGVCGNYLISRDDIGDFLNDNRFAKYHPKRLSALLKEYFLSRKAPAWLYFNKEAPDISWFNVPHGCVSISYDVLSSRWPTTVLEKLDRFILNLSRLSDTAGKQIEIKHDHLAIAFATDRNELLFMIQSLKELKLVHTKFSHMQANVLVLTAAGWARVQELSHASGSSSNPVFVAMCFGKDGAHSKVEMDRLYNDGFVPAINETGYKVTRADKEPTDDYIMNKVLADIKVAPFIVADFTRHRRGVYFEAGFAKGLGKSIIHTCRAAEFRRAHFDTKQLPHILWKTESELRDQLREWIRAFCGIGPYKRPDDFSQNV